MPFRAINYKFRIRAYRVLKITHPKLIANCTPNHAITTTYYVKVIDKLFIAQKSLVYGQKI